MYEVLANVFYLLLFGFLFLYLILFKTLNLLFLIKILKKLTEENFRDNHGHNILKLFDILSSFSFSKCEMKRHY